MRHLLLIALLPLIAVPARAEDSHPLLDAGLEAYEFFCSKCHGKDMVNPGVSSYDLRKFPTDQKDRFYKSVLEGAGDMPAWGDVIYPEELDALWVYVATRGGTEPFAEEEEGNEDSSAIPLYPDSLVSPGILTACLSRNSGAISGRRSTGGIGIDYRLSQALASDLDLDLSVVWFENEQEEESDPVLQTYAMLAYGLCDMVPSHPHYARAIGPPPAAKGALPRWLGMPTEYDPETQRQADKRLPFVTLHPVSATEPYMRAEIGIVYRDGPAPEDLTDLGDRRLALQQGTLSEALVAIDAPEVIGRALTFNPGADFLWHLETGEADVAVVDVPAYDSHRLHNVVSTLKLAPWRHRIGFDISVAVLQERADLRAALDRSIRSLRDAGTLAVLAQTEGVTYAAPALDGPHQPLTLRSLALSR